MVRFGIRLPVPGPFYAYIPLNRSSRRRRRPADPQRWTIFGLIFTLFLWALLLYPIVLWEELVLLVLIPRLLFDLVFNRAFAGARFAQRHRRAWAPFTKYLK